MLRPTNLNDVLGVSGLADHIATFFFDAQENVACNLRLVSRAAAASLKQPQHLTIHLSRPVPYDAFVRRWGTPGSLKAYTLAQRHQFVCLTAASGSISNLKVAVKASGVALPFRAWEYAAGKGHLHVCQWLLEQRCPMNHFGDAPAAAAAAGHNDVCQWLIAHDYPWSRHILASAIRGGHLDPLEWLRHQDPLDVRYSRGLAADLITSAADGCDLQTLRRLHGEVLGPVEPVEEEGGGNGPADERWRSSQAQRLQQRWRRVDYSMDKPKQALILAAAAGSRKQDWRAKVEWLEAQGYERTAVACKWAAKMPDAVERLAWLRQRGYPVGGSSSAVDEAARAGNVAALRYLLSEGARGDSDAAVVAAEGGHLGALQALHAAGCPVDARGALRGAARRGDLAVLAWLVEAPGPGAGLDAEVFGWAAESGSVELMAWLRERGCPWDDGAFAAAAESGCEVALEWLAEQGCPMPTDGKPFIAAHRQGDYPTLRCLLRLSDSWGPRGLVFTACVESNASRRLLRCLRDQGCAVGQEEGLHASQLRRHDDVGEVAALRKGEGEDVERKCGAVERHCREAGWGTAPAQWAVRTVWALLQSAQHALVRLGRRGL